jgi:hypothetical protein
MLSYWSRTRTVPRHSSWLSPRCGTPARRSASNAISRPYVVLACASSSHTSPLPAHVASHDALVAPTSNGQLGSVVSEFTGAGTGAGPTGALGPAGPLGTSGTTGPLGGPIGGPIGPAGPSPLDQLGPTGPLGPLGPRGALGPLGPRGALGPLGPSGPLGTLGARGALGPLGPRGPLGTLGPRGVLGPLGPGGHSCPLGTLGSRGAICPRGPLGPLGPSDAPLGGARSLGPLGRRRFAASPAPPSAAGSSFLERKYPRRAPTITITASTSPPTARVSIPVFISGGPYIIFLHPIGRFPAPSRPMGKNELWLRGRLVVRVFNKVGVRLTIIVPVVLFPGVSRDAVPIVLATVPVLLAA